MKWIHYFFEIYIRSSIHVALAVSSFAGITFIHFGAEPDIELLLFIGSCTVIGYNFTRFDSFRNLIRGMRNRFISLLTLAGIVCAFWLALRMPSQVVITTLAAGFITLLYNGLFTGEGASLREVTGIKIFLIALVWASVTVVIPAFFIKFTAGWAIVFEFLQRFLFIVVLTIPFDIRDVRGDRYELATIPQVLGIKRARYLGLILLSMILMMELMIREQPNRESLILVLACLVTALFILNTVVRQQRYFAAFWIEGIPIAWFAALLVV